MEQLTILFKALSEPARLRIVNLLARRSLCVSDLQQLLAVSQPYVSRHLAFLRHAGLVRRMRRQGRELYVLNLTMATHPFVSLVNELPSWKPELRADREKLEQLELQGTLRADRCHRQTAEPSRARAAVEGKDPIPLSSLAAKQAA
jgi:ArsR family transcriptional regulator